MSTIVFDIISIAFGSKCGPRTQTWWNKTKNQKTSD